MRAEPFAVAGQAAFALPRWPAWPNARMAWALRLLRIARTERPGAAGVASCYRMPESLLRDWEYSLHAEGNRDCYR